MINSIFTALRNAWGTLTSHHQLHALEHVGQFAGSLLRKEDWDHK
jgi:hypothetical protein